MSAASIWTLIAPSAAALGSDLLLACGCRFSGPPRGAVAKVTVDGQPLAEGVISFVPASTPGPSPGRNQERLYASAAAGPVVGTTALRSAPEDGRMIEVGSPEPPGTKITETVEARLSTIPFDAPKNHQAGINPIDFDLKTNNDDGVTPLLKFYACMSNTNSKSKHEIRNKHEARKSE
jgi:hypothetical protein